MSYSIDLSGDLIVNGTNVTQGLATLRSTIAAKANQSELDFVKENTDPDALDSLTEVVAAFQQADSNLNGSITLLAQQASAATQQVANDLAAEITARQAADTVVYESALNALNGLSSELTDYSQRNNARVAAVEGVNSSQDTALESISVALLGLLQAQAQQSHQA